jgi:hypothetical protein
LTNQILLAYIKLINSTVAPIFKYGTEVIPWNKSEINSMDTYLRKIARKMLSLPNLANSALYSAEVNLVNLHDYRFKKVIDFRLNTEDPILNEQLKSFNNTTSKVKKGKIAKNITSYDSLYQACWKAHHEHLITHALSKPEKHPDSLNLQDKIEKKMLSDWNARRQRFYISEVNNATYSTRRFNSQPINFGSFVQSNFICNKGSLVEWSKTQHSSCCSFRSVGSNPTAVKYFFFSNEVD